MKKIRSITESELKRFKESRNKIKVFKQLVGIKSSREYGVGDTGLKVDNAKPLEVYKDKGHYYIIANVFDNGLAFAYSLYPKGVNYNSCDRCGRIISDGNSCDVCRHIEEEENK